MGKIGIPQIGGKKKSNLARIINSTFLVIGREEGRVFYFAGKLKNGTKKK